MRNTYKNQELRQDHKKSPSGVLRGPSLVY